VPFCGWHYPPFFFVIAALVAAVPYASGLAIWLAASLVVLAVAIAFFVRHGLNRGFRDFEIGLLAAAWIVPLLSRVIAGATGIPLGLLVMLALYLFASRRAVRDGATAGRRPTRASVI
jgi:hypothetical protein